MNEEQIAQLTDKTSLNNLMEYATRLGREDIYRAAFKQLCSLSTIDINDPLERDFQKVLAAYEALLKEKNGRNTRATYFRRKVDNKGLIDALTEWALGGETEGFNLLIEKGMAELTAEYLLILHPEQFPENAVTAARKRLGDAGTKV